MSNPINWVNPTAFAYGSGTLRTIDTRADLLSATKIMDEASVERYEFIRNAYFQDRNYKVFDGNPPASAEDEALEKELDEYEHLNSTPAKTN
jgi:phospholipid-binding lipoprotein MlaA